MTAAKYIRSRVHLNKIRELSEKEQWRFCPGSQNPADLPTRMSANELFIKSELWHHRPQYLQLPPDQWPTIDNASGNEELAKRPQEITHPLQVKLETPYSKTEENIFKFERFGRKTRLTSSSLGMQIHIQLEAIGKEIKTE